MKILYTLLIIGLSGCASQIMQSYVGKDLREVILDYGQPTNAFDMGEGKRAFQWARNKQFYVPTTSTTTGSVIGAGNTSFLNANTITSGGYMAENKCVYTLFAKHLKEKDSWIVESYKKPRFMCE
jgi:hypothetical protein